MKKCRLWIGCMIALVLVFPLHVSAAAACPTDAPYQTYIYNMKDQPVAIPAAFSVEQVVTGDGITDRAFNSLGDICYNGSGRLFISDSGNDRVLMTDLDFRVLAVISEFSVDGAVTALSGPQGVWADESRLYVADTGNHRIVSFALQGDTVTPLRLFEQPVISVLEDDFEYLPVKLTVDATRKLYVIASGINQGILCLDENGEFQSFLGAPQVEPNFLEMLWRRIATKEQLARMESYVPTEYSSVTMNSYGFLYVTSATSNEVPVGKINSDGDNILIRPRQGWYGDSPYLSQAVDAYTPYFVDVALYRSGRIDEDVYYTVDSKQGKIYAYTEDGYLLYAFGGVGSQQGTYANANALEYVPDPGDGAGRLIVLDGTKGTVTVLRETAFALHIRQALTAYNAGNYEESETAWNTVLETASGYVLGDIGLARIELHNDQYREAMTRLKKLRAYELYADAFESWRDEYVRDHFVWIFLIAAGAAAAAVCAVKCFRRSRLHARLGTSEVYRGYRYGSYVMLHPFDGFWDLKHEKRGNLRSALWIIGLFFLLYAVRLQFGGYIATGVTADEVNVLFRVLMLLLPLLFFVIANWCFTTLMDGKGTMRDIVIATGYALKPYVVFAVPMLVFSNILTASELPFYTVFETVIWGWVIALLIVSVMMTHDYSLGKTVLTLLLILIGICLIVFILLLVISIAQNIYSFVYNLYLEMTFRSY